MATGISTLSRIFRAGLAGITAGVIVGGVLGGGFVAVNRYLGEGYPQLALDSLRDFLNRYALAAAGLFVLIELTSLLLEARARSRPHASNAVPWLRRGVRAVLLGLGGVKPVAAALVLWAAVHGAAAALGSREPQPRLNVLLITIDALRADHLGAYGYARPTSPNIDKLAREGVLFRRAVAQWPKTSPSFASMLSSTYGHTNGLIRTTAQRMPDRFLLLAELLKAGGYSTSAAVGNVNLARAFNFDQGFDTYQELWRKGDGERTEMTTRHGLELLGQASSGSRPFFLWLHYFDPHARYRPPAPFNEMFVNDKSFDGSRRAPFSPQRQDIGSIPSYVNLGRENRIAYYVAQYDAEIRYVDQQVGLLMKALEERGLAGRTLVILTADHGESLGDHNYFFDHGRFPYDDCVHVPLILRGPGTGGRGAVRSPVELIDLVPTVLDLAGLPPDPQAEGKSLRRLLRGERPGSARWAYAFNESGYAENYQRAITSDRYKLIYVPDARDRGIMQGSELELYDLEKDPGETKNLIDQRPDLAAPLKRRLSRWIADSGSGAAVPAAVHVEEAAEDQLRSLGYVE